MGPKHSPAEDRCAHNGETSSSSKPDKTEHGRRITSRSEVFSSTEDRHSPQVMGQARFAELMQAMQRISRLQREATSARVDSRQKRREASFKRHDVWVCDAKFMMELQRLLAEGRLTGFEEITRLAAQCQIVRDGLGPLEQEGIEAEQRWEGQIWKLRQAEEKLYSEFEDEFATAESYPSAPASDASSEYQSISASESQTWNKTLGEGQSVIPYRTAASISSSVSFHPQDYGVESSAQHEGSPLLLGVDEADKLHLENDEECLTESSDLGVGEIDRPLGNWSPGDLVGPPQQLPSRGYSKLDIYPELITNFTSRRARINRWLENTMLESQIEGNSLYTILKSKLEAENQNVPSNWSQLAIAYWELDGAAMPQGSIVTFGSEPSVRSNKIIQKEAAGGDGSSDGENISEATKVQSQTSSNTDHGYFSDSGASKGGERLNKFMRPLSTLSSPTMPYQRAGAVIEGESREVTSERTQQSTTEHAT